MPDYRILLIILMVLLVIVSAFASSSEIVYATVNKVKVEKAADNNRRAKKALKLINNYPKLLATILTTNILVNVAISSCSAILAASYFGDNKGPIIATVFATLYILTIGEIIPKTISTRFSYKLCLLYANMLTFLTIIFKPIVFVSTKFTNFLSPIWTPKEKEVVTDEELITMVDEIEEDGFIDEETGDLVRNAIDFTDVTAQEIMQPRVDIFAFDIEDDIETLINDVNIFTYSRIPVYEGTIDNIIGIINTQDLIKKLLNGDPINSKVFKEMLAPTTYVHKTKAISAILKEFKKTHSHLAIVVDEFGGTLGLITLEDILEELVGDIWDETDIPEEDYTKKSEDEYIFDGDLNIYDFLDILEIDDKDFESEYITVGGWCTEVLEKFPEVGDSFTYKNIKVTIQKVDGVRVEEVKVDIIDSEDDE